MKEHRWLLLKLLLPEWKNDGYMYLDTQDAFICSFRLHLLVHKGLLRMTLNILTDLHYNFHHYNHYLNSTFEVPVGFFFFNKTRKQTEDRQHCNSLRSSGMTLLHNHPLKKYLSFPEAPIPFRQGSSTRDSLYNLATK